MPLATLTRDITAPFASDTPMVEDPSVELRRSGVRHMIWVTGTTIPAGNDYVGTFQHAIPAGSGDGWLMDGAFQTIRVRGAIVDPVPVNGGIYRALGPSRWLLRYNDEDHRGDRHSRENPWSIIGGEGTAPHFSDGDSPVMGYMDRSHYLRVQSPDDRSSVLTEDDLELEVPVAPEPVARIANDRTGPTRGFAVTGDDGLVEVNPERVVGRTYIVWDTENLTARELGMAMFHGPADPVDRTAGFVSVGSLIGTMTDDPADVRRNTTERDLPISRRIAWAELALVERPVLTADQRIAAQQKAELLRSQTRALQSSYTEFNDALNELAKDKGWCSEYEDIIKPLGMIGRNRKYDVEVSVSFSFDMDSTSSAVDSAISRQTGMELDVSSLTVNSSTTVTIYGVECSGDTDSMSEYISSSDVEDALENLLNHTDNLSVDDWSVEDYSESEED